MKNKRIPRWGRVQMTQPERTYYQYSMKDLYNPPDYFGYYVKTAASPELHLASRGLAMAPLHALPTQQSFSDTYY